MAANDPWGYNNNYWNSTYGRGIGGPNANPYSATTMPSPTSNTTTTPTYTPPSTGTQQAQNNSSMTASDWLDAAKFAYGWYRDRNPPKPEFENVPLSPEQQQIYQIYISSMLNPSTLNNATELNQMARQMMGGLSNMRYQSPRTFSGDVGYGGSSMAFTPPTAGANTPPPRTGFAPTGQPWTLDTLPNITPAQRGQTSGEVFREAKDLRRMAEGPRPPATADFTGDFESFRYMPSRVDENDPYGMWRQNYDPYPLGDPSTRQEDIWRRDQTAPKDDNTAPDGTPDRSGFWAWLKSKVGGAIPDDEEGRERWAARGLSIISGGAFGLPIPPAVFDKGWDGLQWIYRQFFGNNGSQGAPTTGYDPSYYNDWRNGGR